MAWTKIPPEHHPLFRAALPDDKRVQAIQMFGGVAGKVNGHMFGGLFARSAMVKLSPDDQKAALALDGAVPFDPMGNGRVMSNSVLLPESVMDEPAELRSWLRRAFDYAATLPAKPAKPTSTKAKPTKPEPAKPKPTKAKAAAKPAPRPKAKAVAKKNPAKTPRRNGSKR